MKKVLLLALIVFGLSGCMKNLQLLNFKTGDSAEGFWDAGKSELRVYLEDGDVLRGKFVKMSNARFSIGASIGTSFGGRHGAFGAIRPSIGWKGVGNVYALLQSDKSSVAMEVVVDYNKMSGKGHGEARTNDGRVYKVVL
jgi:hypothetical protein